MTERVHKIKSLTNFCGPHPYIIDQDVDKCGRSQQIYLRKLLRTITETKM